MAAYKPLRVGDTVPQQQINPATEEIDGKIYVSGPNKVLGRVTSGAGPHEEIDFGDLPGGGAIVSKTYADWETDRAAGLLTPGAMIFVSDRGDTGMFLQCTDVDAIGLPGQAGFLNADFQAVGNYDGVEGIVLQEGQIYYFDADAPFTVGETITGSETGATAEVVSDDAGGTLIVTNLSGDWDAESGGTITGDVSGSTASFSGWQNEIFTPPFGEQKGIWRQSIETSTIIYYDLSGFPASATYYDPTGPLEDSETYSTNLGGTGTIINDDEAGTVTLTPDQPLSSGEIITGDTSGNSVTVDVFTPAVQTFSVGDTITGQTTGATASIVTDDGGGSMTVYITSPGTDFDGSEVLDNGNGVTATMDGLAIEPDISEGDVVIWNLLHWQLTDVTAINGSQPDNNTGAYALLEKSNVNAGYVEEWDAVRFSWDDDGFLFRADKRGNEVTEEFVQFGSVLSNFRWGHENVRQNIINKGNTDIKNSDVRFEYNTVLPNAQIEEISGHEEAIVAFCIFNPSSAMRRIRIETGQIQGIILGVDVDFLDVTTRGEFSYTEIGVGSIFQNSETENLSYSKINGEVQNCNFSNFNSRLNIEKDMDGCNVSEQQNKTVRRGFSDFPATLDITDATALDLTAAFAQYVGLYTLTSENATEEIDADSLSNFPTLFPFRLIPAAGLELTLTCTAAGSATTGSIVGSASTIVLNGDNGDFVELEADSSGDFVRVKNLQQYI